jgi:hypothetical protein
MGNPYPDRIPLANPNRYAVSVAQVVRTGALDAGSPQGSITFDVNGKDPIASEFRVVRDALIAKVTDDPKIQETTRAGNQANFEERLADLVGEAMAASKYFGDKHYRSQEKDVPNGISAGRDLNHLDKKAEYDCEGMSHIKGLLLHYADRALVDAGKRAEPTIFYITSGAVSGRPEDPIGGHQFLISAATGNIIEGTTDGNSYQRTKIGFPEHIAGFPSNTTKHDIVYTHHIVGMSEEGAAARLVSLLARPSDMKALENMWHQTNDQINPRQEELLRPAITTQDGRVVQTGSGGMLISAYPAEKKPAAFDYGRGEILEKGAGIWSPQKLHNGTVTASILARDQDHIETIIRLAYAVAAQESTGGMKKAIKQAIAFECTWSDRKGATSCQVLPETVTPPAVPTTPGGARGPVR